MYNSENKTDKSNLKSVNFSDNDRGRVGVPILLYFLGVPGIFVVILWFFFFRGN